MPEYFIPAPDSNGSKYHAVNHDDYDLVPATEEEVLRTDLSACGTCARFHGLVPIQ